MPTYKFSYFDLRGRGELSRYVFLAADRDFEDNRVQREDWPALKASSPFGQMPFLEVDGKMLAQSDTIARFLAKEFNLMGKNNWEEAQINQFVDLVGDMFTELIKGFFEKDEEKKKELNKKMVEEVFPKFTGIFEKALVANGGTYMVGDSLSLADLAIYNAFDTPLQNVKNVLDSSPKIKAARARIEALPKLGEYVKNRKHSDI